MILMHAMMMLKHEVMILHAVMMLHVTLMINRVMMILHEVMMLMLHTVAMIHNKMIPSKTFSLCVFLLFLFSDLFVPVFKFENVCDIMIR